MIPAERSYSYFVQRFKLKRTGQGWWAMDCPVCRKAKKMCVQFNYEWAKCWSCGYNEPMINLVMDLEGLDYYNAKLAILNTSKTPITFEEISGLEAQFIEKAIDLPEGFNSLLEDTGILGKRAVKYLKDRGFDVKELDRRGFGFCNEHAENEKEDYYGRIIIPFQQSGVLQYFIGRDYIGNEPKYKNPSFEATGARKSEVIFNADALDLYDRVYVLEGWADAVTIGDDAVALLGWSLSKVQQDMILNSSVKELVFVPDSGFYAKAVETAVTFLNHDRVVYVPDMDKVAEAGKDVNEMGRDVFMQIMDETDPLQFAEAVEIMIER